MVQNTDERHFQAVKHVLKSTVAVKNTLETMKKNIDIVKLDPVIGIGLGKNLEQPRRFFSTTKRKRKNMQNPQTKRKHHLCHKTRL